MSGQSPIAPPFDDDTLALVSTRAKRQIRARMRALRQALPADAMAERSARIVRRLAELDVYRNATSIACYAPMPDRGEVDPSALATRARVEGKRLFYPYIDGGPIEGVRIGLRRVVDLSDLEERGRGFPEPPANAPEVGAGELDLVVVPALALDAEGRRLGQGSGFYDTVLPRFRPPAVAVGVAFDFQLVGELPAMPHDVACDLVVTDAQVLDFRRA